MVDYGKANIDKIHMALDGRDVCECFNIYHTLNVCIHSSTQNHLEQYYNIVFDQIFSPNTKHLVTCDRYGRLAVFRY